MPECQIKHIKLRALLGLINAFLVVPGKEYTLNIAKLMVKRNFASDIAKIFHSLDLNSSDLAETANNIVRTIEALTKLLYKTPGHQNQIKKPNKTMTDASVCVTLIIYIYANNCLFVCYPLESRSPGCSTD